MSRTDHVYVEAFASKKALKKRYRHLSDTHRQRENGLLLSLLTLRGSVSITRSAVAVTVSVNVVA